MNKCIQRIIKEQFNISNMDFNRKPVKSNIFNKNIVNPENVYNKILSDENSVYDDEIDQLNNISYS